MHLLSLKRCAIHRFQTKTKTKLADGPAQIHELKDQQHSNRPSIRVSIKQYVELLEEGTTLVLLTYDDSFSYLLARDMFLLTLSFDRKTEGMEQFRHILDRSYTVYDIESRNIENDILEMIQTHFPSTYFQKQILSEQNFFKKVGSGIGDLTGKMNKALAPKTAAIGSAVGQKSEKLQKSAINDQKRQSLQQIKQKAQKVNSILSTIMRPAINAYNKMVDSVSESFQQSDNKIVKSIREASIEFSESINKAQKKAESASKNSERKGKEQTEAELN